MEYKEAVELALKGNEQGFQALYEQTYKDKYYIALKYMKNETDAQDVLQDAYMKAFSKLDTLNNPEVFSSWLGQIVANTAKNALVKKNPILFTDMNTEEDLNEQWEDTIEEHNVASLPEDAFTQKETQEIVQELISALSDEQRMCIMMFYIEEQSIKEIAQALDCSENTVKSRLNYGRKNIKTRAEELEKKGYKLYSVAPLPLLLILLRMEMGKFTVPAVSATACSDILQKMHGKDILAKEAVKEGTKQAFIHTVAGKVVVAVAGVAVVGGIATGVIFYNMNKQEPAQETTTEQEDTQKETQESDEWKEVGDTEYEALICGGLTKEQLGTMLACGPETISGGKVKIEDMAKELTMLCSNSESLIKFDKLQKENPDDDSSYDSASVNKFFSVFGNNIFSDGTEEQGVRVKDNKVMVSLVSFPWSFNGEIITARYNKKTMLIEYNVKYYHMFTGEGTEETKYYKRTATLIRTDAGFQIQSIESQEIVGESESVENPQSQENPQNVNKENNNQGNQSVDNGEEKQESQEASWQQQYFDIIKRTLANDANYRASLSGGEENAQIEYRYALVNMSDDAIPELIIEILKDGWGVCTVYQYSDSTKSVAQCADQFNDGVASAGGSRAFVAIPPEGYGLYQSNLSTYNGNTHVTKYQVVSGTLIKAEELDFPWESEEQAPFNKKNKEVKWHDMNGAQQLEE